jgi:excisionase family DNA binding protein
MPLLSRVEAAQFLRISIPMLDLLKARGELSSVKIGRRVLFDSQDLLAFIEKSKNKAKKN